jgi:DNA-binding transcriptional LysR family regulator
MIHMLELGPLRALQAVAKWGSIGAAAEALHLTNSAVSQRLAKLERDVGQVMLERHGRGIRLTDAAKLLVGHVERILSLVDVAETALEGHRGAVVGRLSIAGFPSAARGLLPQVLATLRTEHPQLQLQLHEQEPEVSVPSVVRGDVDIAVVQDWFTVPLELSDDLQRANLLDDVMDLALPASHPLAGRDIVDFGEFAADDWVTWPSDTVCGAWLRHTLKGYGVEPRIEHSVNEYPTQLALVAAGFGVAVIPRLGRDPLPSGVCIAQVRPRLGRHVYAVWRAESAQRPALLAAVDVLVATAKTVDHQQRVSA